MGSHVRREVIGPIFFEGTISANRYWAELFSSLINELHDDELRERYFQQDDARAHTTPKNLNFFPSCFRTELSTATCR